jgi:RluA family pseudouridine synthase
VSASFTNISCYKFAPLSDLKTLREQLLAQCKAWALKGTILLSTEGINFFVAGLRQNIDNLVAILRSVDGLADLTPKYSESGHQPFTRMLVRIKKEIIAFGVEGISPGRHTSPKLAPATLKQWLDEGRPLTLLDTRNAYEVKLGTFRGARSMAIDHFRDFPEAVRKLPPDMKKTAVVMFCTGGIRCEKAGPFMEREGFEQIYQLDGGILKYFEECGAEHYEGECFVFDQRVGVDPSLRETESTQCYQCQTPLNAADQKDARFVEGVSCPYCHKTSEQHRAALLKQRQAQLEKATTPLPGSVPYENKRPINVAGELDRSTLLEYLCTALPQVDRLEWIRRIEAGRFQNDAGDVLAADQVLRAGERCIQVFPAAPEPDVNPDIRILHEDEALLIVHKPAPLPTHPSGRFNRNTLQYILSGVYAPQRPRFVNRLDANTTGLVLCARTRHFAGLLQRQFKQRDVEKVYLVRALGHPTAESFICDAPIGEEPGSLGAHAVDEADGREARTEFKVLARFADGTSLLEARPITGRTNQIRIHLWHLGWPIQGDTAYLPNGRIGDTQTISVSAAPLCLHAWRLAFDHPLTGERVCFESAPPAWTTH